MTADTTTDDIKALEKEVRKLKRLSQEVAMQLHDLVEDRLPAGYAELPPIAQATYDACARWAEAERRLALATESR